MAGLVVILPEPLMELFTGISIQSMRELIDQDNATYDGWYCINIKPQRCNGCGEIVAYLEPPDFHLIVVWEHKDDDRLLRFATELQKLGAEPRVETYNHILGDCIPWEAVEEIYE